MNIPYITMGGFAFLLLLICIGYVFVEALGPRYNHRIIADHIFERAIQYVIRGMLINTVTIILMVKANVLGAFFVDSYNASLMFANMAFPGHEQEIIVFNLIVSYFTISMVRAVIFGFIVRRVSAYTKDPKKTLIGRLFDGF